MKYLHLTLLLGSFLLGRVGFSQYLTGEVQTVVELGLFKFCIVYQEDSDNYYKSSTYSTLISIGQQVTIDTNIRQDGKYDMVVDETNENLVGTLMGANTSNFLIEKVKFALPEYKSGILYFEDTTQLNMFVDIVAKEYLLFDDTEEVVTAKLDSVESLFKGFSSYRSYFNKKYDLVNTSHSESDVLKIINEDFIKDDVLKNILSESRLVGIGDSIFYFHDLGEVVSFPKNYTDGINYCDSISRVKDLRTYDFYDENGEFFNNRNYHISAQKRKKSHPKGLVVTTSGVIFQTIVGQRDYIEPCSKKRGIQIGFAFQYFDNNNESVYGSAFSFPGLSNLQLIIDWKDGSVPQIINNYSGDEIIHSYQNESTYYPSTIIRFNYDNDSHEILDGQGTSGTLIKFKTDQDCSDYDLTKVTLVGNSQWKMIAEIWYNKSLGIWIGARTTAFEVQSNGELKKKKANIKAEINGDLRNEACLYDRTKSDSKERNNDKELTVRESSIFNARKYKIGNNDIKSTHFLKKNGTNLNLNQSLTPCP